MRPEARTQAAIELLDQIIAAARDQGAAADTLIARYFAARRYAGSKDRRAVRELVYDAIRLLGERPASGRAAMLALARRQPDLTAHFGAGDYAPEAIGTDEAVAEAGVAPQWLVDALAESGVTEAQQAALLDRAPLDIRVNPLRAKIEDVAEALGEGEAIAAAPLGLRLPGEHRLERHPLFESGGFEIQDAGSQAVTLASAAGPGMLVVDLCAGGGGKTLAMAAMMANRGRIVASDSDRARLSRLPARAERAGVSIAETRLLNPGREAEALADLTDSADVVLVDAPCSGTGTWRRNPEARWRLTPDRLARLTGLQARLLDMGAALVRPGGALIHIVCSLLDSEGRGQVDAFLARHPGWEAVPLVLPAGSAHGKGMRLTPASDATDGFFVARLTRPC
ncbi:RsmB/NOP family class I SAM-dependent RNA methyltransferase [Stakelama pacifica]|uniref:16S rRNA (Cytosine967-C5)-methyltransferase n=1 Tax=Stakelama pacifica TaxID=517720 RepID=A0A4R6FXV6_9SPHN|nr:RsmB/NOP family class I SAM-dependent RNA methyltransferase [Stakelama pacifica]TDN86771.1 16S rRNA (cytosine967-C5)-methyltransferase [Stakelama pacifica]GGO90623.1 MFS transporter [Stakelama pacifica]